jgi:thiamine biosynthesis lipoprotein
MKKYFIAAVFCLIFLTGCAKAPAESENFALNTICTQQVWGDNAQQAVDEVNSMLQDITNTMSMNEGSEVYAINEAATGGAEVSQETAGVISEAIEIAKETNGAFDPAIGAITVLWDITGNPRVPSEEEINGALKMVDYNKIHIEGTNVSLAQSGMKIDLGGIAKGYAADKAIGIYKKYGIESALLNLGGNIYAYGKRQDGKDYRIGIRDPLGGEGEIAAVITVSDTSVVTSGVYERYFVDNGVTYHHIIDPKTGHPADNGLLSVSIICNSSIKADGLSTALFVMGLGKGLKFANGREDIQAIFITEDKKIYVTDGLKGSVEITNEAYTLES